MLSQGGHLPLLLLGPPTRPLIIEPLTCGAHSAMLCHHLHHRSLTPSLAGPLSHLDPHCLCKALLLHPQLPVTPLLLYIRDRGDWSIGSYCLPPQPSSSSSNHTYNHLFTFDSLISIEQHRLFLHSKPLHLGTPLTFATLCSLANKPLRRHHISHPI